MLQLQVLVLPIGRRGGRRRRSSSSSSKNSRAVSIANSHNSDSNCPGCRAKTSIVIKVVGDGH